MSDFWQVGFAILIFYWFPCGLLSGLPAKLLQMRNRISELEAKLESEYKLNDALKMEVSVRAGKIAEDIKDSDLIRLACRIENLDKRNQVAKFIADAVSSNGLAKLEMAKVKVNKILQEQSQQGQKVGT